MSVEQEVELEEMIYDLFGPLWLTRLENAGVPLDRYPHIQCVLSHIRECLNEEAFGEWVKGYIELESPTQKEDTTKIRALKKDEQHQ